MVRFRTLGCWPLTGAVESEAQTLPKLLKMLVSTTSERQGRVIDRDRAGSMELKKRRGISSRHEHDHCPTNCQRRRRRSYLHAQQHKSLLRFDLRQRR